MGGTFVLTDPFMGMSSGQNGPPAAWTMFGTGIAFGVGVDPGGMFVQQSTSDQYHWYRNRAILTGPSLLLDELKACSIFFGFRVPSFQSSASLFQLNLQNALSQPVALFSLRLEQDMSLSYYAGAVVVSNSDGDPLSVTQFPERVGRTLLDNSAIFGTPHPPPWVASFDTWYYCQMDVTISKFSVSGNDWIGLGLDMQIEGQEILKVQTTPIGIGFNDFFEFPFVDRLVFLGPGTLDLSQVYVVKQGFLGWPEPVQKWNDRVSQAVIDSALKPKTADVLLTQGIIEQSELPSTASVRISQAVIELIPGKQVIGGGWTVKEA